MEYDFRVRLKILKIADYFQPKYTNFAEYDKQFKCITDQNFAQFQVV